MLILPACLLKLAKSIKRVTEAFVKKEIDESELREKTLDEQRQALLRLYCIGTASVVLINQLQY